MQLNGPRLRGQENRRSRRGRTFGREHCRHRVIYGCLSSVFRDRHDIPNDFSPLNSITVTLARGHHRPDHPRNLVGKRDGSHLGGPPRQQCREPGPMFGVMDFGIADDGERPGHEQAAQIYL